MPPQRPALGLSKVININKPKVTVSGPVPERMHAPRTKFGSFMESEHRASTTSVDF